MSLEHSALLPHCTFTRRGFLGASAGAAAAAALPAALLTGASVGAATLTIERRAVYGALVEAVALLPMNSVDASRAGWATDTIAGVYARGDRNRRLLIDRMIDSVAPGRARRFTAISPRARVAYLRREFESGRAAPELASALDLAARPFRGHHTEPPAAAAFTYLKAP
jgi:hypothetical protein